MSFDTLGFFPTPQLGPKLRINYYTEDPGMHAKGEVVKSHSRLGRQRVANGILSAHHRRIEKNACADCITGEAEHIEQRKVGKESFRRTALVVEPGLRIEGQRPGCEIQPSAKTIGRV